MKSPASDYGALRPDGYMNTRSGLRLSIFDPQPNQIVFQDWAAGLACKPHYSGQIPWVEFPLWISQHSVLVAWQVFADTKDPLLALVALLHDSDEGYFPDFITQIKAAFPQLGELGKKLLKVIFEVEQLPFDKLAQIKYADVIVLKKEHTLFYHTSESERAAFYKENPMWAECSPKQAYLAYLAAYNHYRKLLSIQNHNG
jgi:5'-deoxynucleotidase YfbR-like HD superfamily hydrolase